MKTWRKLDKLLSICRERKLAAAINFQLRFAPFIIAARDMIERGLLGELYDIEFRVQVNTPWHLWGFLFPLPRVEILYHSIHYVDLVRSFCGTPQSVYAKTMRHPTAPDLRGGTRSMIIMDYGEKPARQCDDQPQSRLWRRKAAILRQTRGQQGRHSKSAPA